MNRIALRLSIGLLSVAVIVLVAMPWLTRWHFSHAMGAHAQLHDRLVAISKLPADEREPALREIARSFDIAVEVVPASELASASDVRDPASEPSLGARGPFGPPLPLLATLRGKGPRPMPFEAILVKIPGSDEAIRSGPIRPPLWPLGVILLGVVILVAFTGTLLARPLVRRLTLLQETAMRIARGELEARADSRGNDAVSAFAARFNQMADRNQVLLEGQRDLIRGVSHELRTPVARIRFALELAHDAPTAEDRERHLTAIDSDLSEIDELIQELLLVDRFSDGAVAMPTQAFGVLSAVQDEVERQRASRPHIEASVSWEMSTHMTVLGSERLFRRVVRNLVSNALRHAQTRFSVSITHSAGMVVIRVDDDGPGIPEAERSRILEPFVRLDESRSRELGGVGLGLTIVDRILRAVGGDLRIGETRSGGASVAMTWPCSGE